MISRANNDSGQPDVSLRGADDSIRILRLRHMCELTGMSRSAIYRMESGNQFPKRVKLSSHSVGWIEGEVQQWLSSRIETSRR